MSHPSNKGTRSAAAGRMPASLLSIPILLLVLAAAKSAGADSGPESGGGVYLTAAYIIGTLLAIGYKTLVACVKYFSRKIFRLSLLLYPMFLAFLIAGPTVFYALPHFGQPSGRFGPDLIYSFLTTYTIFDITGDAFKLIGIMAEYFEKKNEEQGS